jgi:hypothetical protein
MYFVILLDLHFKLLVAVCSCTLGVEVVLDEVPRLGNPFGTWDWHSSHEEGIKSDGDSAAESTDKS